MTGIEQLYKNKLFNDMCKRYGRENHEDLKSEVLLILLELPKEKLRGIIDKGYLIPFALNVVRNQTSPKNWTAFRKKYGNREDFEAQAYFNIGHHHHQIGNFDPLLQQREIYTSRVIDRIDDRDIDERESREITEARLQEKIISDSSRQQNQWFYHSRLFLLQQKFKNSRKMAQDIGIPYRSIRHTLNEYTKHLKKWLKESAQS